MYVYFEYTTLFKNITISHQGKYRKELSERNGLINTKRQKKKRGSPDTGHNTVGIKRKENYLRTKKDCLLWNSQPGIDLVGIDREGRIIQAFQFLQARRI